MKHYYAYIMTNKSRTLYTGITNNIGRRVQEHKNKLTPGFTSKYNITMLVYYEEFGDVRNAIAREKPIKGWLRTNKIALIEWMRWQTFLCTWFQPKLFVQKKLK